MSRKHTTFAWTLLLFVTACSTPTFRETYNEADPKRRALVLALFDMLTAEQRQILLQSPSDPKALLDEWKIQAPEKLLHPEEFAPLRLSVETDAVLPVKDGRTLPIHAWLEWPTATRKRLEVSDLVQWTVQPQQLAWTRGNSHLDYECVRSDITLSADFIGERSGRLKVPFEKKIRKLNVEISEDSQVIQSTDHIHLKAQAYCEDGTQADVTCQTQWKLPNGLGRMAACGNLQVLDPEALKEGVITITGEYGRAQSTRRLHFKTRTP